MSQRHLELVDRGRAITCADFLMRVFWRKIRAAAEPICLQPNPILQYQTLRQSDDSNEPAFLTTPPGVADDQERCRSVVSVRYMPCGGLHPIPGELRTRMDTRPPDCPHSCRVLLDRSLVPDHEFFDPVLRLLASRMVGLKPRAHLPPQLGLAVPAETLAALARPLDLGEMAVVRLEDVVVLGKDRTDVRVRPEAALLFDGRPPTRERVHDLLLGLGLRVRRKDARLRNRSRHLAGRSEEARKELVVYQGGLRIAELRCHVSSDPEMRVLIDAAGDEDGDVATRLHGGQERGGGLQARVEDLADVGRVLESEDPLRRRESDPFRDFHRDRVQVPDVLRIEENPRELRVESHSDDVQDVVIPDLRGLLEVIEILEEELLVVRDLKV